MSDAVLLALIAAVPGIISAMVSAYIAVKQSGMRTIVDANTAKIEDIHSSTNGMKDALIKAAGESGRAEGVIAGVAGEKIRAYDQSHEKK